ncbi:zincin [Xylona heveae TC161]|uniref:Zincin n=1 Tax=Xylona heveae (strain CBS 132557 / TC161) TaxID=1328760 RepID=A0A165HMG3_XYLHT|nr:zincin [Xylona heveae TC161]KZF23734.1 zincin [Xylona heveae TC161]
MLLPTTLPSFPSSGSLAVILLAATLGHAAPAPASAPGSGAAGLLPSADIPGAVVAGLGFSSSSPQHDQVQVQIPWSWNLGAVTRYPIHASCNATERRQLEFALDEAMVLAGHARDHILRHGASSRFYTKYFGNASTAEPAGWFDRVVNADKGGIWFRCDDIDGNCKAHETTWAGHWRGSNATDETVICPLSYTSRRPLTGICGNGYTVSQAPNTAYFASDLLHRIYHMPRISENVVDHYADTYEEVLELAQTKPQLAVRNSATLRYFALDVFAWDVALPREGCSGVGEVDGGEGDHGHAGHAAATTTTAAASTGSVTAEKTTVVEKTTAVEATATMTTMTSSTVTKETKEAKTATTTQSAAKECHTHDNGVVHCA